jgi:hypothetical protein
MSSEVSKPELLCKKYAFISWFLEQLGEKSRGQGSFRISLIKIHHLLELLAKCVPSICPKIVVQNVERLPMNLLDLFDYVV